MVSRDPLEYTFDQLFHLTRSAGPPRAGSVMRSQGCVGSRSSATIRSPHLGGIHVDDS
jgi:hypothetical protein